MSRGHVVVVGGGLAGLTSALQCADGAARVTLLEARSRLGGATWSTRLRGLSVDNGQHVFLRCCDAYQRFLARVEASELVEIQPRLAIPVCAPGRRVAWIRRSGLPSPAHLAPSLLRFHPLPLAARLRAALTARRLGALDPDDPALDGESLGDWLLARGESPRAVEDLWDLLVRPTLNLSAREASLALAAKVFRTGLLGAADAADVGAGRVPFSELHEGPARRALEKAGVEIRCRQPVTALRARGVARASLRCGGDWLEADAVILAVPHRDAARLLPPETGVDPAGLRQLGSAPIVNLHVVFDRRVTSLPMLAALDSPLQWVFDRTRAAGLEQGQYLAVSLSAADAYLGRSRASLRAEFLPALRAIFPAARGARLRDFFVTAEPEATFRQAPGTRRHRPGPATAHPGLLLAGAWTDTGWPATMEGAVRSGEAAARLALAHCRRDRTLERAA